MKSLFYSLHLFIDNVSFCQIKSIALRLIIIFITGLNYSCYSQMKSGAHRIHESEMSTQIRTQKKINARNYAMLGNNLDFENSGIGKFRLPTEAVMLQIKDSVSMDAHNLVLRLGYLYGLFKAGVPIDSKLDAIRAAVPYVAFSYDYKTNEENLNRLGGLWRNVQANDLTLYETYIKPLEITSSLAISYANYKTELSEILSTPEIKIIIDGYKFETIADDQRKLIDKIKAIHTNHIDNICEKDEVFIRRVVQDFDDTQDYLFSKYPKIKKYLN